MGGNQRKGRRMQKEYHSLNKWSTASWSGPAEELGQWSTGRKHLTDFCGMETMLGILRLETLIESSIKLCQLLSNSQDGAQAELNIIRQT